jgi:hypothetical protein
MDGVDDIQNVRKPRLPEGSVIPNAFNSAGGLGPKAHGGAAPNVRRASTNSCKNTRATARSTRSYSLKRTGYKERET